jgi:hypothetical protein
MEAPPSWMMPIIHATEGKAKWDNETQVKTLFRRSRMYAVLN